MTKKSIDNSPHNLQYIIARIILVGTIGFLIYGIYSRNIGAIIICSLFLIYTIIMLKQVFYKPVKIEFDENYIYLENGNKKIKLNDIIGIEQNRIVYKSHGIESEVKLQHFISMDKKWTELEKLINNKAKTLKHK